MSNKVYLAGVTLVIIDTQNISLALSSLRKSESNCRFDETLVFTSSEYLNIAREYNSLGELNCFKVGISSISEYSLFILRDLKGFVSTPFVLITQWDSWVINPSSWDPLFLRYDYVGAVWPHHSHNRVGNGGFSLRSHRLLEATSDFYGSIHLEDPIVEDDLICRRHRSIFEENGIRFAPEAVANRFSTERMGSLNVTFGFHGLFNFGSVMDDNELEQYLKTMPASSFSDRASYDLCTNLTKSGKIWESWLTLRKRIRYSGFTSKNIRLILLFYTVGLARYIALKIRYIQGASSSS